MGGEKHENREATLRFQLSLEISQSQKVFTADDSRHAWKISGASILCSRWDSAVPNVRLQASCNTGAFEFGVICKLFNTRPSFILIQSWTYLLSYIFPLPQRDVLGRRVIMYRPSMFNPSKHINYNMVKIHAIVYETLLEDELNQINGIVHVIDSSGMGLNYMTIFTPHEAYRIGKNLEVWHWTKRLSILDNGHVSFVSEIVADAS